MLALDEVEDVASTLDFAEKIKDYRSQRSCLEMLDSDRVSE